MDAVPNPTGTDVDSCQKACCDDPACDAYQWTDSDPITFAPSCLTGTCNTPQDCGANPIPCQWTGEQGKTGGGAPAKPPPGQPGGDAKKGEGTPPLPPADCLRLSLKLGAELHLAFAHEMRR